MRQAQIAVHSAKPYRSLKVIRMLGYENFDLEITPAAVDQAAHDRAIPSYRIRVINSPTGEADEPFSVPFSETELENFILRIGVHRGRTRRKEAELESATKIWGTRLFGSVFVLTHHRQYVFERRKD